MTERWRAALALLPELLDQHVVLSASALALGLALGLPLALMASRSAAIRWPTLFLASLVQTIPSLALLALFYPLLLVISGVFDHFLGLRVSALGFAPSLLALTLYSMLPILRTAVAALLGVDKAVMEAARGMGMTRLQRLMWIEVPLAAPVAMAGVRTAAVWTIGAATLSTSVGQPSLGNFIFQGLQTEDWVLVIVGCLAAAGLALATDQLLGLMESGLARRRPERIWLGAVGLAAGLAAALSPSIATETSSRLRPAYIVGAKNFSEQAILAELIAGRLAATGAEVSERQDLGSATAYRALASGDIDVYVDYSGTLWTNVLGRRDDPGREAVLAILARELRRRDGVVLLGPLGFENAYVLAMRRDRARRLNIRNIDDLRVIAPKLRLASDIEFLSRPEWRAVRHAYDLHFASLRSFQPTFMYNALADGEADVISAFSSDGRIDAQGLVVLADTRHALPPYDAVLLLSPQRSRDQRLIGALTSLINRISVEAMRAANYSVDRNQDKHTPRQAAIALARKLGLRFANSNP